MYPANYYIHPWKDALKCLKNLEWMMMAWKNNKKDVDVDLLFL